MIGVVVLLLLVSFKIHSRFWFKVFKVMWIAVVVPLGSTGIVIGVIVKRVYSLRELGLRGLISLWIEVAREIWVELKAVTYEEVVGEKNEI